MKVIIETVLSCLHIVIVIFKILTLKSKHLEGVLEGEKGLHGRCFHVNFANKKN